MNKRTVQLLLIDGTAGGRLRASLDNWTGIAYKLPKPLLAASKDREELKYCGVYFLIGRDEETKDFTVYIGQAQARKNGESLLARFSEHSHKPEKAFCNEVVFFTSSADDFGPTELCYLENRFWNLARCAGQCRLSNNKEPSLGNVTEAKEAELDRYIENARILLQSLGYPFLEPLRQEALAGEKDERFYLRHTVKSSGVTLRAEALWNNAGFVLLKGSDVLNETHAGLLESLQRRRAGLLESGGLAPKEGSVCTLQQDLQFDSPSGAGGFVLGSSCNGRTAWTTSDGETFAEIYDKKN